MNNNPNRTHNNRPIAHPQNPGHLNPNNNTMNPHINGGSPMPPPPGIPPAMLSPQFAALYGANPMPRPNQLQYHPVPMFPYYPPPMFPPHQVNYNGIPQRPPMAPPMNPMNNPPMKPMSNSPQDLKEIENFIVSLLRPKDVGSNQSNPSPNTVTRGPSPPPVSNLTVSSGSNQKVPSSPAEIQPPTPSNVEGSSTNTKWKKEKSKQTTPKTKKKDVIKKTVVAGPLLPRSLEKLTTEIEVLAKSLKPSQGEFNRRLKLFNRLHDMIKAEFKDATLHLFGSSISDFGLKSADLDMMLMIELDDNTTASTIVHRLAGLLRKNRMRNVNPLPKARVPICKFTDPQTNFCCDICLNNELAIHNTKLQSDYAKIDHRVRDLALVIKWWTKKRDINNPYRGTLSSYAYMLMLIHFLQMRKPPVLPCLQQMPEADGNKYVVEVNGHNVYYYTEVDKLKDFGAKNTESLGELLGNFFKFYATEFDWANQVISVRTASFIHKKDHEWDRSSDRVDEYMMCIEDPFETSHNLGRVVIDREQLGAITYEFSRAYKLICSNDSLDLIVKPYEPDNQ